MPVQISLRMMPIRIGGVDDAWASRISASGGHKLAVSRVKAYQIRVGGKSADFKNNILTPDTHGRFTAIRMKIYSYICPCYGTHCCSRYH